MVSENTPIYLITTMTELKPDERFMADVGRTRAVAFYFSLSDAFETVINNAGDIWETCYDYAVIEEVEPGLYPYGHNRWFFKYDINTGLYNLIDEPDFIKHYINFTIG